MRQRVGTILAVGAAREARGREEFGMALNDVSYDLLTALQSKLEAVNGYEL